MSTPKNSEQGKKQKSKSTGNLRGLLVIGSGVVVLIAVLIVAMLPTLQKMTPLPHLMSPTPGTPGTPVATTTPDSSNSLPSSHPPMATASYKQYDNVPTIIDAKKQYSATFKMAKGGEFVIQLYADKAPIAVNSFVFLARDGFFNGTTFHRVLEGFMAQGGDPSGTGAGGPGYDFKNEDSDLKFDKPGVFAMANAGRDTNGSQFFITFTPVPNLDGGYTIFGQVISGMDVVNGITRRDPDQSPNFTGDVIESVTIEEK
jgi:cyclophilin family peptidyl-prolyl cis-trans isomerase